MTEVRTNALRRGNTKSCGCYNKDRIKEINTKYKQFDKRLYRIYNHIKDRCYRKNDPSYKWYGAHNIKMCDEWLNDFETFYNWSMNNGYKDNLTIDRIDVNNNYEPSNCRWVDMKTQCRNRTSNKYYTINGETRCLTEWCEILNLNYGTVQSRLLYGWSIEKALLTPIRSHKKLFTTTRKQYIIIMWINKSLDPLNNGRTNVLKYY